MDTNQVMATETSHNSMTMIALRIAIPYPENIRARACKLNRQNTDVSGKRIGRRRETGGNQNG